MVVKIDKNLFDYLIDELGKNNSEVLTQLNYKLKEKTVILTLDEDTADDIRDWAGEKLQQVGFDKNYNTTLEGKKLEAVVDLFYAG